MNPEQGTSSYLRSIQDGVALDDRFFEQCSIALGVVITLTGVLGIVDLYMGFSVAISPGSKPIAFSAALIWIFFGLVVLFFEFKKIRGALLSAVQGILIFIAAVEAAEIPFNIQGGHFIVESVSIQSGNAIFGTTTTPISPVASFIILPASILLLLIIRNPRPTVIGNRTADIVGGAGVVIAFTGFSFVLGYFYGSPFLYGTQYIPIAFLSVAAACFMGIAFVTMAGPGAFPLRHFVGDSTRARLLRIFVPLTGIIVLAENFTFVVLSSIYPVQNAVRVSASLVVFMVITSYVVARLSSGIGRALDEAEDQLVRKNEDLNVLNEELNASMEELTATEEELRQTVDELTGKEIELRENGQRLRRSQEIAHLGSWDLDHVNKRLTWSDETYRIFGIDPRDFGDDYEAFMEMVHPQDRALVDETYSASAREGKSGCDIEHRIVRRDTGEVRYVREKCEYVKDENGRVIRSVGMVHDITDLKHSEDALRQANAKIGMLSSITRHDILNKITALRSYLELSRRKETDPDLMNYIEKEDGIAKVIAEQIEFTRYYEELGVHSPSWQNVSAIIRRSAAQLNLTGISVDIGIPELEVYADPLIEKVFYNLLDNSIRHGVHVTRIVFSFNESQNGGNIIYSDNGIGIAADDKKKIFAKGFGNHTGLGLFLSREILSITGITIEEEGVPGTGVRFGINVPNEYYRLLPGKKA